MRRYNYSTLINVLARTMPKNSNTVSSVATIRS